MSYRLAPRAVAQQPVAAQLVGMRLEQVNALMQTIHHLNPHATVVKANSRVTVDDPTAIAGKPVAVKETRAVGCFLAELVK